MEVREKLLGVHCLLLHVEKVEFRGSVSLDWKLLHLLSHHVIFFKGGFYFLSVDGSLWLLLGFAKYLF